MKFQPRVKDVTNEAIEETREQWEECVWDGKDVASPWDFRELARAANWQPQTYTAYLGWTVPDAERYVCEAQEPTS